jgi:hypothetical protein
MPANRHKTAEIDVPFIRLDEVSRERLAERRGGDSERLFERFYRAITNN